MKDFEVLLIGGSGRSGTNVLKNIFREHPDAFGFAFETRFTIDPDGVAPTFRLLKSGWTPLTSETALDRLASLLSRLGRRTLVDSLALSSEGLLSKAGFHGNIRAYKEWELQKHLPRYEELSNKLLAELRSVKFRGTWAGAPGTFSVGERSVSCPACDSDVEQAFRTYLTDLYSGVLEKKGSRYYVDDNTFNILFASELLLLLSNARLVHVVRDPRDVVASYMKQRWTPNTLEEAVAYYKAIMRRWAAVRTSLPDQRYIEIRLEDLCLDRRRVLKDICSFCGIDFVDSLLEFDLSSSNTGRWRVEFSKQERQFLQSNLSKYLSEYGYAA